MNLSGVTINSNECCSINVSWDSLPVLTHGVFQGYEFRFVDTITNDTLNFTIQTEELHHLFKELRPGREYNITARPLTLEGFGKWSNQVFAATEEGK